MEPKRKVFEKELMYYKGSLYHLCVTSSVGIHFKTTAASVPICKS